MHNKIKPFREIQNNQIKLISLNIKYIDDMWEYSKQKTLYEYFEYDCHKNKKETESYLKKLIKRTEKNARKRDRKGGLFPPFKGIV